MHTGLSPSLPIEDNLALTTYRRPPLSSGPFLRRRRIREQAEQLMTDYDVRAPGPQTPTRVLSGGNVDTDVYCEALERDPARGSSTNRS